MPFYRQAAAAPSTEGGAASCPGNVYQKTRPREISTLCAISIPSKVRLLGFSQGARDM